jgi:hypothetical protein
MILARFKSIVNTISKIVFQKDWQKGNYQKAYFLIPAGSAKLLF